MSKRPERRAWTHRAEPQRVSATAWLHFWPRPIPPPQKSRLTSPPHHNFPLISFPPAPKKGPASPEQRAQALGERDPGSWLRLLPSCPRAVLSASSGDGSREKPPRARVSQSPTVGQLLVPGRRTRCHRQSERFAGYNQEKKLRRSEQLNGSQICFSAAFPHSAFMYLA